MPRFKNQHLSYSRLSRFEQCPLSFKLHYIDKKQADPGVPLRFGKAVHAVLENLVREHMEDEREGPLSEDRAVTLWQEAWAAGELSGIEVFEEGLTILRSYVRRQGHLDHQDVLAIEKRFELSVGPFAVLGFIDRVDRVGHQLMSQSFVRALDVESDRSGVDIEHAPNTVERARHGPVPGDQHLRGADLVGASSDPLGEPRFANTARSFEHDSLRCPTFRDVAQSVPDEVTLRLAVDEWCLAKSEETEASSAEHGRSRSRPGSPIFGDRRHAGGER